MKKQPGITLEEMPSQTQARSLLHIATADHHFVRYSDDELRRYLTVHPENENARSVAVQRYVESDITKQRGGR